VLTIIRIQYQFPASRFLSLILGRTFISHFGLHRLLAIVPDDDLLIAMTGIFLGYSLAHSIGQGTDNAIDTQVLVFFIMIFLARTVPGLATAAWLSAVHKYLPIVYMADLSRGL